jgi:hypothetical protein
MSAIQPYHSTSSSASPLSRAGREIARIVSGTELAVVRVAAQATVEDARLDAIDGVAGRGLQGVAMVTQLEQQLAQSVPLAAGRLQAIGDMHALAVAQEVTSFSRRLP